MNKYTYIFCIILFFHSYGMENNSLKRKREPEEVTSSKMYKYDVNQLHEVIQRAHGIAYWQEGSRKYYLDLAREIVAYYDSEYESYLYTVSDDEAFQYYFDPSMFYELKNKFESKDS